MNINRDGSVLTTHRVKPLKNSEIGNQQEQADQSSTIYESPSSTDFQLLIQLINP